MSIKVIVTGLIILGLLSLLLLIRKSPKEDDWKEISSINVSKEVVDKIVPQLRNYRYEYITLLDSTYKNEISVETTINHYIFFFFDYYTFHIKKHVINIKTELFLPPYVIYKDTLFCSETREITKGIPILKMKYYLLKKIP
jgi:hypothetical protein